MGTGLNLDQLYATENLTEGQLAALKKTRFSLGNIWNSIVLKNLERHPSLLITGCSRGDGSSFVALHMALLVAVEFGLKTLLVDADLDKRRKNGNGGTKPTCPQGEEICGMFALLQGLRDIPDLIRCTPLPTLSVLPSGVINGTPAPGNLFSQKAHLRELIDYSKRHYDVVIFDCPPMAISPWAISVSTLVDLVLLVSRYARSRREVCRHTIQKLEDNGVEIAGVILNERRYPLPESIYNWLK